MNYIEKDRPHLYNTEIAARIDAWSRAMAMGEPAVSVFPKASEAQLRELEKARSFNRELQENRVQLEYAAHIADVEYQAMNPKVPMDLDYSDDHEFVPANQQDAEEDLVDAKEEEKRRLTKDGRICLKASRVFKKVVF